MGLPNLYEPPENGWPEFWFQHYKDHEEIVQAINAQLSVSLPIYIIQPWGNFDRDGILERHQQFHNDFNEILGIPGNDLSELDFNKKNEVKAWLYLNFIEHLNARTSLGI